MISSISSTSSAMSMMRSNAMQRQPPPQGKDAFQASDVDGNGLVSKTELSTLTAGIEKITGKTISVDDSMSTYDTDQDGSLSGEELLGMMNNLGFSPPQMSNSEASGDSANQPPPPPPPSAKQVTSAYSQNSGSDDMMAKLLQLLQQDTDTTANSFSPISVMS